MRLRGGVNMTMLVIEPGKCPMEKEIGGSLEEMQRLVGGCIQVVYPFKDEVALICNEEGKIQGLPLNRALRHADGAVYDIISGPFFLCAAPADSESFESLTEEQVKKYSALFHSPEIFLNIGGQIICLPTQ